MKLRDFLECADGIVKVDSNESIISFDMHQLDGMGAVEHIFSDEFLDLEVYCVKIQNNSIYVIIGGLNYD